MKKSSTIRALENKARKDDINALFQLAEYYEEGVYVDKDIVQAEEYFSKVVKLFERQSLQISSVKLVDFRGFENVEIEFCTQFKHSLNLTVLIGSNGAGKTTILESLAKNLSWLINIIRSAKNSGRGDVIEELDIRNNSSLGYTSIITQFLITNDIQYDIELSKSKSGSDQSRKNNLQNIRQLADIYKYANSKDAQFNFPIMAFYSVQRAYDIEKDDIFPFDEVIDQKNWNKFDAYNKTLSGDADFKSFLYWFKYLEDINNATSQQNRDVLNAIDKLQAELDGDLIKEMEKKSNSDKKTKDFLLSFKQDKQVEIDKLKAQLAKDQLVDESSTIIKYVTKAIYKFMPEFKNLRIQRRPFMMFIDKNNTTLNILQLSKGEQVLLAMVADIVRRLVLLNPSLSDPLQGRGIVLIDEIDLHLHPKWQQTVIPNLLKTFPNIQFIVTTHSPQVATTADDECIRILRDGKVHSAPKGSRGAKSSRLLKRLFEVEVRPPNDSNSIDLAEYKNFVYSDKWECQQAQELRKRLDQQFGDEEPDLTELDLYIENRIWEIELEKDQ